MKKNVAARAPRGVWKCQLAAMTERLLEGDGLGNADVAEIVRALAWAVTAGDESDNAHVQASERVLGRLRSLAVVLLREEQERLAHVPEEDRYLVMHHQEIGPVLVGPTPVHQAHAMTDEVREVVRDLVAHPWDGLDVRDARSRDPHKLAWMVIGPLLAARSRRLRALVPLSDLEISPGEATTAVRYALDNTDPSEAPEETARRILSAVLRTLGASPMKVKQAIQATTRRR